MRADAGARRRTCDRRLAWAPLGLRARLRHRGRHGLLIVLGLAGSLGNPLVGGPESTGLIVTGFGHDLAHLVRGALFLHVGLALTGRQRAYGLVGLGVVPRRQRVS